VSEQRVSKAKSRMCREDTISIVTSPAVTAPAVLSTGVSVKQPSIIWTSVLALVAYAASGLKDTAMS